MNDLRTTGSDATLAFAVPVSAGSVFKIIAHYSTPMTLRALQRPPEKDRDERNGLSPSEEPRIRLGDLPERSKDGTPRDVLRGLEGAEGTSCARDCDCAEGLVCRRGACTGDW